MRRFHSRPWLEEAGWPPDPRALPLLPLVYAAWRYGSDARDAIEVIEERLERIELRDETRARLRRRWLNPESAPRSSDLHQLVLAMRRLSERLPESPPTTLVDFGLALLRDSDRAELGYWSRPTPSAVLGAIEKALGISSQAACQALLSPEDEPQDPVLPEPRREFDVEAMAGLLGGAYADTRMMVKQILRQPQFRYEYGLDRATYRERVQSWTLELARYGLGALGYPEEYGGSGDPGRHLAVVETLALHDLSLAVKFGGQFGLFGGGIQALGTKRHHQRYLRAVGTLALPGCFAMSEAAHGSDSKSLETIARYDPEATEFVLHTPTGGARKVFVANAAVHGRMAIVFAQLEVKGARHGVHAFLVPLRSEDGHPLPGVRIEDSGEKLGLNGVDNGTIWFDRVRIPREQMLNRFAYVSTDGVYATSIPDQRERFANMLGPLLEGRLGVAAASLSAAKSGLTIALRWGSRRRQFGPPEGPERRLLDYPVHRRRLMPQLATAFALDFTLKHLVRRFLAHGEEAEREIASLVAGLKAYASWYAVRTLQNCREACGGAGYMAVNRFASLRADTDVFTTLLGDNTVLMLGTARRIVGDPRQRSEEGRLREALRRAGQRAANVLADLNPIVSRMGQEAQLLERDFQLGALRFRETERLARVAGRLRRSLDSGSSSRAALIESQEQLLALAWAHLDRVIFEQFAEVAAEVPDPELAEQLGRLVDLFALSRLEDDRAWFLESGHIEAKKSRALGDVVAHLCAATRRQALHLVNAFAIPDEILAAPIAFYDVEVDDEG